MGPKTRGREGTHCLPCSGTRNGEIDLWTHCVGTNLLLQSMHIAINLREISRTLLTDFGRYEEALQIWSI